MRNNVFRVIAALRPLVHEGFKTAAVLIVTLLDCEEHGESAATAVADANSLLAVEKLEGAVELTEDGIELTEDGATARIHGDSTIAVTRDVVTYEISVRGERAPEKTPSRRERAAWRRARADHWERSLARYMRGPDQTRSRASRRRSRERAQARKLKYA